MLDQNGQDGGVRQRKILPDTDWVDRTSSLLSGVQHFDSFAKVKDSVRQEQSITGGIFVVLTTAFILWLAVGELMLYLNPNFRYKFRVDTELHGQLQLNLDMIVAMPCSNVDADIMDSNGAERVQSKMGKFSLQSTSFDLSEKQTNYWRMLQSVQRAVQDFTGLDNRDALQNTLHISGAFRKGWSAEFERQAAAEEQKKPRGGRGLVDVGPQSCRIHGSILLNKVAGNVHITEGKVMNLPGGIHAHVQVINAGALMNGDLSQLMGGATNFSHRIFHLGFGSGYHATELVSPLDGTLKVDRNDRYMYQYYIQIVPTTLHQAGYTTSTYQYAVTERDRLLHHDQGSHGRPALYFKYDVAPFRVLIFEDGMSLIQLLLRLCAVVGGVSATSHMIFNFYTFVFRRHTAV